MRKTKFNSEEGKTGILPSSSFPTDCCKAAKPVTYKQRRLATQKLSSASVCKSSLFCMSLVSYGFFVLSLFVPHLNIYLFLVS